MRFFLARHAETVFNADARMQGDMTHTPLTRAGIAQAEAMGAALATHLACGEEFDLWVSPTGRTLQTAAILAEHLGRNFFQLRTDARLLEIDVGDWQGRRYADIVDQSGPILDADRRLFTVRPPGGESYRDVAGRLKAWLSDLDPNRDVLVVSHGMTLRVLRGLLAGGEVFDGTVIAEDAPQGTIFHIEAGAVSILHDGVGMAAAGVA